MKIEYISENRYWLAEIKDREDRTKNKGFNTERGFVSWVYNLLGLSFKDNSISSGSINKRSVIHYLQRNSKSLNNQDLKEKIDRLSDFTDVKKVRTLFLQLKQLNSEKNSAEIRAVTVEPVAATKISVEKLDQLKQSVQAKIEMFDYKEASNLLKSVPNSVYLNLLAEIFDAAQSIVESDESKDLSSVGKKSIQLYLSEILAKSFSSQLITNLFQKKYNPSTRAGQQAEKNRVALIEQSVGSARNTIETLSKRIDDHTQSQEVDEELQETLHALKKGAIAVHRNLNSLSASPNADKIYFDQLTAIIDEINESIFAQGLEIFKISINT